MPWPGRKKARMLLEEGVDMENKKRILIADASNEFRKLLCDTIGGEPDLEVVGATGDG